MRVMIPVEDVARSSLSEQTVFHVGGNIENRLKIMATWLQVMHILWFPCMFYFHNGRKLLTWTT
jgi:hypothetical protein